MTRKHASRIILLIQSQSAGAPALGPEDTVYSRGGGVPPPLVKIRYLRKSVILVYNDVQTRKSGGPKLVWDSLFSRETSLVGGPEGGLAALYKEIGGLWRRVWRRLYKETGHSCLQRCTDAEKVGDRSWYGT